MKFLSKIFAIAVVLPWMISCASNDLGPSRPPIECTSDEISYLTQIKPIVEENCSRCHNADFTGKDWTDPAQLKEHATEAARRVQLPAQDADHMPLDPPELTETEITYIVCWARQGAPIDN